MSTMTNGAVRPDRAHRTTRGRVSWCARLVGELLFLAGLAVAAWFLWPASLGGGTHMIAVQGTSMEPKYHTGDVLMVRDNPTPELGEIVVFRIPDDEPGGGKMVVHRLVAQRADGSFVSQGDNRDTPDSFHITHDDIVGSPMLLLPHFADAVGMVSTPTGLGVIGGALMMLLLWPDAERRRPAILTHAQAHWHPSVWRAPRVEDFMADAEAWLEREIATTLASTVLTTSAPDGVTRAFTPDAVPVG